MATSQFPPQDAKPTVFIAGAGGFIGRYMTERLAADGYRLRALVRPGRDTAVLERLKVEIVRGDLTDLAVTREALRGASLAINLTVSRARHPSGFERNRLTNVQGAANLASAAAALGLKQLVHGSSAGVYGIAYPGHPVAEDAPLAADTNYRATKVEGEAAVRRIAEESGLPVSVARISTVYGPGSLKGWPDFARTIARRGRITGIGPGRHHHHLTHVEDVVEALLHLLLRTAPPGFRCFNVGADPIPTLREVFDAIARGLGRTYRFRALPRLPFVAWRAASTPVYRALGRESRLNQMIKFFTAPRAYDTRRLTAETGWRSRIGIEEGMADYVEWMRRTGHLDDGAREPVRRVGEA